MESNAICYRRDTIKDFNVVLWTIKSRWIKFCNFIS